MRADAVKNRERILRAAEEVFASHGLGIPIDEVAERAGLGVGTLYRHFPTKEALFEAIVLTRIDDMVNAATAAAAGEDPGAAFFEFVMMFARQAVAKHDLVDACSMAGMDIESRWSPQFVKLRTGVEALMERAVAAGAVRADVTVGDVMGLVIGACHATDKPGLGITSCERILEVVCDGLRRRS